MSVPTIFAVPMATQHSLRTRPGTTRKRKRNGESAQPDPTQQALDTQSPDDDHTQYTEYTAVVTPAERSQRRLAGSSLDQDPPPFPFPHASLVKEDLGDKHQEHKREATAEVHTKPSLQAQHLAAITALLHRCMMVKDYARAGRALGLLLRNEVGGQAMDIRSKGLWGIGAEILLRQSAGRDVGADMSDVQQKHITREGFEHAKLYYERLIVQYPKHKTWPDAVNALDFCTALFSLWVHVANQESLHLQQKSSVSEDGSSSLDDPDYNLSQAKHWELKQAKSIAEAMDLRMRSIPFNDSADLIRLRAMVALWTADLVDVCAELDSAEEMFRQTHEQDDGDDLLDQVEPMVIDQNRDPRQQLNVNEASESRSFARMLFSRLKATNTEEVVDGTF